MASGHVRPIDLARNSEYRNAPSGPTRGIERAAASRCLDNDDRVRERRNDPIALEELPWECRVVGFKRREHRAAGCDHLLRKRAITPRKELVVPASEHADRRSAHVQRTLVRCSIDAERQTGDDAASRSA